MNVFLRANFVLVPVHVSAVKTTRRTSMAFSRRNSWRILGIPSFSREFPVYLRQGNVPARNLSAERNTANVSMPDSNAQRNANA